MGLTTPSNKFIWGLAKQTNESTIATIEEFGMPVYSGRSMPVQTFSRVDVTDASSIVGDSYKQGDIHWEADVVLPAFGNPLPKLLVGLHPTDTLTGVGPFTHTMSGLGAVPAFFTTFNTDLLGGAVEETFEAGIMSEYSFSGTQEGGPARVGVKYVGKRPTIASYTNATVQTISADGYYTFTGGSMKYEVDAATPVVETNIQTCSLLVSRPVTHQPTVDSTSVNFLALERVECSFSMTLLMANHEAYRATFFGAVAGSTPSTTKVQGSVELNFVHSVQGTWNAKVNLDKAVFVASPPQPDPAASPLLVTINGMIDKPTAGDHVKWVVINGSNVAA
ncbi:MAG: hypothetical protein ACRDIC_06135 [bacterium]